ncbi:hypothetical protein A3844_05080 [Paenibacillus helianthi]|uniref:DUF4179 domain-containing protein n=1 Tax=Paenibacillus helianthi TaxID=1349432 RepID=A0ABX3ETD1_9BACL|nr:MULTISPECIES: hypothetical protein [Paenibacillus]OKP78441.1 hypothetical protein A3842_14395 [Paenibacillus sp. P3E]OKP91204.1 hypothetical protein A3844_05080 [Paenibacillus helianthi]
MRSGDEEKDNVVMTGAKDWYTKAGRSPFAEDGFTPELMARIEAAAGSKGEAKSKFRSGKNLGLTCLAALMVLGVLIWPLGGKGNVAGQLSSLWEKTTGAAVQPTPSPSAASQGLGLNMSSAEFEIGGLKYYMPMPLDRNKSRAFAVETSAGIVWSPPPPMVDYMKPKYTHNTEPYTLYLTPKGHSELSAATAKRIYTFPLYAGGAQTYFDLGYIYGAGDYLLFSHSTYTLGAERVPNTGKFSIIDIRKAEAGELIVPRELLAFDSSFTLSLYYSFMAIDPDREEVLLVNYTEDGKDGYTQHSKLLDIATGKSQVLTGTITMEKKERPAKIHNSAIAMDTHEDYFVAHYEVKGEERTVAINIRSGQQWFYDWWYKEYGQKIEPSATPSK